MEWRNTLFILREENVSLLTQILGHCLASCSVSTEVEGIIPEKPVISNTVSTTSTGNTVSTVCKGHTVSKSVR